MKRIILATRYAPPRVRHFNTPPAAAAPAADPGADPGASNAPPPNSEVNQDVLDFKAPEIDDVMSKITGDPAPVDPAKAPTDPAKAPTDPKAPTNPPPAKNDPPAKQLRDELDRLKQEHADLKRRYEAGDPKLKEAQDAVKAKEAEISARDKQIQEYREKLALADPEVVKELTDLDSAYNTDASRFYTQVPELNQAIVNDLVKDYHALPFGKPEYRDALAAFEAKVNTALGAQEGGEHRKLGKAMDFIERTRQFAIERPQVDKRVRESALSKHQQSTVGKFTKERDFVKTTIEKYKGVPEGLEARDPLHPIVMMHKFYGQLTDEQRASYEKGIPEFLELAIAGVKPLDPADYPGMTEDQMQEAHGRQAGNYQEARTNLVSVAFNGMRALRLLPAIVKDWQRLREKLGENNGAQPPDPTKTTGNPNPTADDDLKTYTPPSLEDVSFG